jgi:hypothetical protein
VISWLAFSTSTWPGIAPNDVAGAGPFPSAARIAVTAEPKPQPSTQWRADRLLAVGVGAHPLGLTLRVALGPLAHCHANPPLASIRARSLRRLRQTGSSYWPSPIFRASPATPPGCVQSELGHDPSPAGLAGRISSFCIRQLACWRSSEFLFSTIAPMYVDCCRRHVYINVNRIQVAVPFRHWRALHVNDQPDFHFEVTGAEIRAAIDRGDYPWFCEHVFGPALAQFFRKKHTAALVKGSTLPRSRRPAGARRHRNNRTRRISQVPG